MVQNQIRELVPIENQNGQQEILVFQNNEFGEIRTAGSADYPLFCLSDICKILEIQSGATKKRLDQRGIILINTPTSSGEQQMLFINEKNLYKLIMRSDKPKAEPFQDWVCGDVLPTIRKTGSYSTATALPDFTNPAEAARAWALQYEKNEQLQLENKKLQDDVQTQQNIINLQMGEIDTLAPKGRIYDQVILTPNTNHLKTTSSVANEIGMSGQKLNNMLVACGIIYKAPDGEYLFTSDYRDWQLGQSVSVIVNEEKGLVKTYIKWNERGRAYIHALNDTNWDKRRAWHLLRNGKELAAV